MATGLIGAEERLAGIVKWRPLGKRLREKAAKAPALGRSAMGKAVAYWYREASIRLPVRAAINERQASRKRKKTRGPRVRRSGRGQLLHRTFAQVRRAKGGFSGAIHVEVPYAIWLAAGTRHIAGGAVMRWAPGKQTVKKWPAKTGDPYPSQKDKSRRGIGGNPRAELPIVLPWQGRAQRKLVEEIKRGL